MAACGSTASHSYAKHDHAVEPQALVHALHTSQQLASEEGRALPEPEAQFLKQHPGTLGVGLALCSLPDGYISASAYRRQFYMCTWECRRRLLCDSMFRPHAHSCPCWPSGPTADKFFSRTGASCPTHSSSSLSKTF